MLKLQHLIFVATVLAMPASAIASVDAPCSVTTRVASRSFRPHGNQYRLPLAKSLLREASRFELLLRGNVVGSYDISGSRSDCVPTSICFAAAEDPRNSPAKYELRRYPIEKKTASEFRARSGSNRFRLPGPRSFGISEIIWRNVGASPAILKMRASKDVDRTSVPAILASILPKRSTDATKAKAIFNYLVADRYHWFAPNPFSDTAGDDSHDPVKFVNVYGYGICDDAARNFVSLARAAGLRGRIWYLNGHVVAEAYYDGAWHMFDVDHEIYYVRGDGVIASVDDLARDPSPITRSPRDPAGSETQWMASFYTSTEDNRVLDEEYPDPVSLEPRLEPGDVVTFPYANGERAFSTTCDSSQRPPSVGNGSLARDVTNSISIDSDQARVVVEWPYLLLNTSLTLELKEASAANELEIVIRDAGPSRSTKADLHTHGDGIAVIDIDSNCRPHPTYRLELEVRSSKRNLRDLVSNARLTSTFQFSRGSLPSPRQKVLLVDVQPGSEVDPEIEISVVSQKRFDCDKRDEAASDGTLVEIRNAGRIAPSNVTVKRGSTVRWRALEGGHRIAFSDGFSSSVMGRDDLFVRTFPSSGRFEYACAEHASPSEQGVVEVFNPVSGDFDLDGRADVVWWRAGDQSIHTWGVGAEGVSMNVIAASAVDAGWSLDCAGDVNGDGFSDLLWRNTNTRAVHYWQMRRSEYVAGVVLKEKLPPGAAVAAVRNIDDDPAPELLIVDESSGEIHAWKLRGQILDESVRLAAAAVPPHRLIGFDDFDGDCTVDAAIWDPETRQLYFSSLSTAATEPLVTMADPSWEPSSIGDFNGDGQGDILWRNRVDGDVNVWYLDRGSFMSGTNLGRVADGAWTVVRQ